MSKPNNENDTKIINFTDIKKRKAPQRPPPEDQDEPILNLPPVVKALSFINIGIFLLTIFFSDIFTAEDLYALSFVPARYFGDEPFAFNAIFSPITHLFLHGGWLHLSINIGTLMAFGAGLEKKMGGHKLLLLYFVSGLMGALFHALFYPNMVAPMIGASGAISGLFGAILMFLYCEGMMGGTQPPQKGLLAYKKLFPFIAIWIVISLFFGLFGMPGTGQAVAWTTHIGGFISGLLLYRPILHSKIHP